MVGLSYSLNRHQCKKGAFARSEAKSPVISKGFALKKRVFAESALLDVLLDWLARSQKVGPGAGAFALFVFGESEILDIEKFKASFG